MQRSTREERGDDSAARHRVASGAVCLSLEWRGLSVSSVVQCLSPTARLVKSCASG